MRKFGLIGKTLSHSFSADYFSKKFASEGIAQCQYSLYELENIEQVGELIASNTDLCGFNVTIPYKREIIPLLDTVDFEAEQIGAVNCVKIADGKLYGYNTDIAGLRLSLAKLIGSTYIEQALILGTGGASLAVQYLLAEQCIPYELISRDERKATITYDTISPEVIERSQLIINTTPLGTYPNMESAPSLPYAYISPSHFMLDLVYNPEVTQFLDYGMQRGATTLNGYTMLVEQAEESWRIWNS